MGREIERYKRETEEEMRKECGRIRGALSTYEIKPLGVGGGSLSSLMSPHG
jgi:hypothetical protein